MGRRVAALAAFISATIWPFVAIYFWEFVRSVLYEQIARGMHGLLEALPLEILGRYGPSALFVGTGFYLFHKTGKQKSAGQSGAKPNAPMSLRVTKWITPLAALDECADKSLRDAALKALHEYEEAKQKRDTEQQNKGPYEVLAYDLTSNVTTLEFKFLRARQKVFDDLIGQLKAGILVGRALPFNDKKLEDNQDWEIIKSSHWSVLRFEATDTTGETISGGGRTYKGLQIGKPQGC